MYKVYITINNKNNQIMAIESDAFLADIKDWIFIDEGVGEKYLYAQNQYLPKSLANQEGMFRYLYVDNNIVERSEEEMQAEYAERVAQNENNGDSSNLEERVNTLEESLTNYELAYYQGVNEA